MKRMILGAGFGLAAIVAAQAADAPAPVHTPDAPAPSFFVFSDTTAGYRFLDDSREPGLRAVKGDPREGRGVPKNITFFTHADNFGYGTNFVNIDVIKSGSQDPTGFAFPNNRIQTGVGATEVYAVYRGSLSGNAFTAPKTFAVPGLIKDFSLSYGFDLNGKDTAFGPRKRVGVTGLVFALDVPAGFINVAVHAYKEFNRNGIVVEPMRSVEFNLVPEFEISYNIPLAFTGLPLRLAGFSNIVLPKGRNGFGQATETEWLSRSNLLFDLGKYFYNQPNRLEAFIGFQYWRNKFGEDQRYRIGAESKNIQAGFIIHAF
ncbi:hypothetical protein [Methylobacterium organophilum]|uniref:Uncharacterized protein n=1 Tax=Methylobacterium organophilum TaxID=410 RepID=A0ABQ4T8E7_METOR|nr:hypothetical protein [Methylobacterium organophilum]GJE27972.1 hypothetical protein LKMONMHP_2834 [Methylobacterium organophilum]